MNWKQIEGQWDRLSGQVKTEWEKLTDEDVADIAGKRQHLVARLQERYGALKGDVERQINGWLEKVAPSSDARPTTKPPAASTHAETPD